MLVGLLGTILLFVISPNLWSPIEGATLFTGEALFPLSSPGIVSIPLGFAACFVGTWIGSLFGVEPLSKFKEITVMQTLGTDVQDVANH